MKKLFIGTLIGLDIHLILVLPFILHTLYEANRMKSGIISIDYPSWLITIFWYISWFLGMILAEKYTK